MRRISLDIYDDMPDAMRSYLRNNGWHFNRKACDFAMRYMRRRSESGALERVACFTKEQVDEMLKRHGISHRKRHWV